MKRKKGYIVWTAYFNSRLSRRQGRRVPLSLATRGVIVEDLVWAANQLGLQAISEPQKKHPAGGGRVIIIGWTGTKHSLIKKMAPRVQQHAGIREKEKTKEKEKKKKRKKVR